MKTAIFDTSSIISIATNNLLWVIPELKKRFKGEFYISEAVKKEIIDAPLQGKKYKLEAMQVLSLIGSGHIKIYKDGIAKRSETLKDTANRIYKTKDTWIRIVHDAEIECLEMAIELKSEAYVIDERNTRMLVENPEKLGELLEKKLHTKVEINQENLKQFKEHVKDIKIIRSTELMIAAYELGIMNEYLKKEENQITDVNLRKTLVEGMLWGLKIKGCAITNNEMNQIIKSTS